MRHKYFRCFLELLSPAEHWCLLESVVNDPVPRANHGVGIHPRLEHWLDEQGIPEIQVLLAIDDRFDISGALVARAAPAQDEAGRPSLDFRFRNARLTSGVRNPAMLRGFMARLF